MKTKENNALRKKEAISCRIVTTEEYTGVDIAKFFFCLCIICLHTGIASILPFSGMYIEKIIFRNAVPYFFVASGFFLGKKM